MRSGRPGVAGRGSARWCQVRWRSRPACWAARLPDPTILDVPPMRIEVLGYPDPRAPYRLRGQASHRRSAGFRETGVLACRKVGL